MGKLNRAEILSACDDVGRHKKEKPAIKQNYPAKRATGPLVRYTEQGNPVKIWSRHIDSNAWTQAQTFAKLPFVHPKGLALMPDVHLGKDVPIGSVLPTLGAIVPAAVGVDIGCGMAAVRLDVHANQLPDHLARVRRLIEQRVPLAGGGRHKEVPQPVLTAWNQLQEGYTWLQERHPKAARPFAVEQLGTLGTGNHFIEVCLDESQQVWVMLHSGSRGAGAMVGQYFINQALERARKEGGAINGLGWLREEDPLFWDYVRAVEWGQKFASLNRQCMLHATLSGLEEALGRPVRMTNTATNCHHNYIARENHYGSDVWITRKGAIAAAKGQLGIIPSAMGQESLIVEGLGEESSFCSCSHGAGRAMSRSAAKARFTAKDLRAQTVGVECRKDKMVVDEIPSAYKPLKSVMEDQLDLVTIKHRIKAVVCIKGV